MSKFEQVEQLTMLVKNAVKRPPTREEEAAYGSIFTLCEMGKELEARIVALEAENRALRELVRELEGRLAKLAQKNSNQKRVIQMLEYRVLELKGKPIPMEPRQFIPSSNRSNAKEAGE